MEFFWSMWWREMSVPLSVLQEQASIGVQVFNDQTFPMTCKQKIMIKTAFLDFILLSVYNLYLFQFLEYENSKTFVSVHEKKIIAEMPLMYP